MSRTDWDSILKVKVDELSSMSTDDIDILYELMCNVRNIIIHARIYGIHIDW